MPIWGQSTSTNYLFKLNLAFKYWFYDDDINPIGGLSHRLRFCWEYLTTFSQWIRFWVKNRDLARIRRNFQVELFAGKREERREKHKQVVACSTIELMALHCDGYLISDLLLWLFLIFFLFSFTRLPGRERQKFHFAWFMVHFYHHLP